MAVETDRRPVDRDHQNNDDEHGDDHDSGEANDNEVDMLDDKSVSHVFLPTTRRTIF